MRRATADTVILPVVHPLRSGPPSSSSRLVPRQCRPVGLALLGASVAVAATAVAGVAGCSGKGWLGPEVQEDIAAAAVESWHD